ncbi:MAG: glycosyltransferase, partial [Deltaproteobacteria bacterium]
MSTQKIQLSVVVLFYHGETWIQNCIQSLENQSLARNKYEIIMVDNGGSTPSVAKYSEQPNIKVLHFPENFGFADGNNKALDHAEGDFILLMNQDVVVHFNCLEELISAFESHPQAGVISANMLMVSSKDHIDRYARIHKTVGRYKLTRLGYASYFTEEKAQEIIPVAFVSGNAMCFRR